jgi:hypothetical protein
MRFGTVRSCADGRYVRLVDVRKVEAAPDGLLVVEKAMCWIALVVSSLAVVTWSAEEAVPMRGPTNELADIEPLATRFPVAGLKKKPPLAFRDVAVPPLVVPVNRTFKKPAAVVSVIVTPPPPPPPPPVNVPVTVRFVTVRSCWAGL